MSLLVEPGGVELLPVVEPVPVELGEDVPLPIVVLPLTEPDALVPPGMVELAEDEGEVVSVDEPDAVLDGVVVLEGAVVVVVDDGVVVVVLLVVELVPVDLSRSQPVTAAEARARAATRGIIFFMETPIRTWFGTNIGKGVARDVPAPPPHRTRGARPGSREAA